eukprot:TRINITY_DN10580_c0_g1_i1.p1 TRINITY_DN10580_c0_g1~~TRINITY_DN10580_c0_g1_i1.p1  ORF type:complete len:1972 (+),score=406.11 TRINITY_DN10580_c0_g1_i1:70-5916(+)
MYNDGREVEMKDANVSMDVEESTSDDMINSIKQDQEERQREADSLIRKLEEEERSQDATEQARKAKDQEVERRWEALISLVIEAAAVSSNSTKRTQANTIFSSGSSFSSVPVLCSDSENSLFPTDEEDYYSLKALTKKIPLLEHLLQVDLDRKWVTDEDEEPEGIVEITPSDLKPSVEFEKPVILVFGSEGQGKTQLLRHVQKKFLLQEAKPPEPTTVAILAAMKAAPPPPHTTVLPLLPHNPPIWLYLRAQDLYNHLSSLCPLPVVASPTHSSPSLPSLSATISTPIFASTSPTSTTTTVLLSSPANSSVNGNESPISLLDVIANAATEAFEESDGRKKQLQNELKFFIKQEKRKCILLIDDLETLSSLQLTSFLTALLNLHSKSPSDTNTTNSGPSFAESDKEILDGVVATINSSCLARLTYFRTSADVNADITGGNPVLFRDDLCLAYLGAMSWAKEEMYIDKLIERSEHIIMDERLRNTRSLLKRRRNLLPPLGNPLMLRLLTKRLLTITSSETPLNIHSLIENAVEECVAKRTAELKASQQNDSSSAIDEKRKRKSDEDKVERDAKDDDTKRAVDEMEEEVDPLIIRDITNDETNNTHRLLSLFGFLYYSLLDNYMRELFKFKESGACSGLPTKKNIAILLYRLLRKQWIKAIDEDCTTQAQLWIVAKSLVQRCVSLLSGLSFEIETNSQEIGFIHKSVPQYLACRFITDEGWGAKLVQKHLIDLSLAPVPKFSFTWDGIGPELSYFISSKAWDPIFLFSTLRSGYTWLVDKVLTSSTVDASVWQKNNTSSSSTADGTSSSPVLLNWLFNLQKAREIPDFQDYGLVRFTVLFKCLCCALLSNTPCYQVHSGGQVNDQHYQQQLSNISVEMQRTILILMKHSNASLVHFEQYPAYLLPGFQATTVYEVLSKCISMLKTKYTNYPTQLLLKLQRGGNVKTQALKQLHQILVCKDAFSKQSALSALKALRENAVEDTGSILGISIMLELLSSNHSDFNTKQKTINFFLSLGKRTVEEVQRENSLPLYQAFTRQSIALNLPSTETNSSALVRSAVFFLANMLEMMNTKNYELMPATLFFVTVDKIGEVAKLFEHPSPNSRFFSLVLLSQLALTARESNHDLISKGLKTILFNLASPQSNASSSSSPTASPSASNSNEKEVIKETISSFVQELFGKQTEQEAIQKMNLVGLFGYSFGLMRFFSLLLLRRLQPLALKRQLIEKILAHNNNHTSQQLFRIISESYTYEVPESAPSSSLTLPTKDEKLLYVDIVLNWLESAPLTQLGACQAALKVLAELTSSSKLLKEYPDDRSSNTNSICWRAALNSNKLAKIANLFCFGLGSSEASRAEFASFLRQFSASSPLCSSAFKSHVLVDQFYNYSRHIPQKSAMKEDVNNNSSSNSSSSSNSNNESSLLVDLLHCDDETLVPAVLSLLSTSKRRDLIEQLLILHLLKSVKPTIREAVFNIVSTLPSYFSSYKHVKELVLLLSEPVYFVKGAAITVIGILRSQKPFGEFMSAELYELLLLCQNQNSSQQYLTVHSTLQALGALGDSASSITEFIFTCGVKFEGGLKVMAIDTLGRFGKNAIYYLPYVLDLLASEESELRVGALHSLQRLIPLLSLEQQLSYEGKLRALLTHESNLTIEAALDALTIFDTQIILHCRDILLSILKEPPPSRLPEVVLKALRTSGVVKNTEFLRQIEEGIVGLLNGDSVKQKKQVMKIFNANLEFAKKYAPQILELFTQAYSSLEDPQVIIKALSVIGNLGMISSNFALVPTLTAMLRKSDTGVGVALAKTMRQYGNQTAKLIPAIVNKIANVKFVDTQFAASLKRKLGWFLTHFENIYVADATLHLDLLTMLNDADISLRKKALRIVVRCFRVHNKGTILQIVKMLQDKSSAIKKEVVRSLGEIGRRQPSFIPLIIAEISRSPANSMIIWRLLSLSWEVCISNNY